MKYINSIVFYLFISIFLFFSNIEVVFSNILINEFSASNSEVITDETNNTPDWVELYNSSDKTVNLKNYSIAFGSKYQSYKLPDTNIAPKGHIVIFCDGKNYVSSNYEFIGNGKSYCSNFDNEFTYYYVELDNEKEFEIELKLMSMSNYNFDSKIGIMVRKDLKPYSLYSGIFVTSPDCERYFHGIRDSEENPNMIQYYAERFRYPYAHLILKLENDTLKIYRSEDSAGIHREEIANRQKFIFPDGRYYLGLASTSGHIDKETHFIVEKLKINGISVDPAALKKINIGDDINGSVKSHHAVHANFRLDKDDGKILLYDNNGKRIDYVKYDDQKTDISYGRFPDGSKNFVFFDAPTPGKSNANKLKSRLKQPVFSLAGGIYNKAQISVELKNENKTQSDIYYTVDGSDPDINSIRYAEPLIIDSNTVLRAVSVSKDTNYNNSLIKTNTYFVNESTKMPIVSLAVDSLHLWNNDDGILREENLYYNKIVPANFEYFANSDSKPYNLNVGLRLNGAATRSYPQKSWRVYSEDYYQEPYFNYPFFADSNNNYMNKYKRLVLRNAGNDWSKGFIRDQLAHAVAGGLNQDLNHSPIVNVLTFLNGRFYGIADLMERHDKSFLADKYDIDKNSITMAEINNYYSLPETKYGSPYTASKEWMDLMDTLDFLDMNDDGLEYIKSKIDIDNYIDYIILNSFLQNRDWISNNVIFWKSEDLDNRWRWMVNDMDITFAYDTNKTAAYNNYYQLVHSDADISILFRRLIKSDEFYHKYLNRFADLLNSSFQPANLVDKVDKIAGILEPEIQRQHNLYDSSCVNWNQEIDRIREFVQNRAENQRFHLRETHKLKKTVEVNLRSNIENACNFKINTITVDGNYWSGAYFVEAPIEISVLPNKDYKFIGWSNFDTNKTIVVFLPVNDSANASFELEAIFEENFDNINITFDDYPNPIFDQSNINIETDEPAVALMEVRDLMGNHVYNCDLHCFKGKNSFNFEYSKMNIFSGVYFINIYIKNKLYSSHKIIYYR